MSNQNTTPAPVQNQDQNQIFSWALERAHLPANQSEYVVSKTPSGKDTIILLCGNDVYHVERGEYGGWLLRDVENAPKDLSACRAFLARPNRVVYSNDSAVLKQVVEHLSKNAEFNAIISEIKKIRGQERHVELIQYEYTEVAVKEKKRTNRYIVLDLQPLQSPRRFSATALEFVYVVYGTRSDPASLKADELVEKMRLAGYNAAKYMYTIHGEKGRTSWIVLKLIVDAPQFLPESAPEPTASTNTAVSSTNASDAKTTIKETLMDLKKVLSEISGEAPPTTAVSSTNAQPSQPAPEPSQPAPSAPSSTAASTTTASSDVVAVRLLLFTLPSEYRKTKTEIVSDSATNTMTEVRRLDAGVANAVRALRVSFYNHLSRVAYKFHDAWALYHDVTENDLKKLIEIANEIEDTLRGAGVDAKAEIVVIPALIPRDYLSNYLNRYIEDVKKQLHEEKNERKRRELKKALDSLIAELNAIKASLSSAAAQ